MAGPLLCCLQSNSLPVFFAVNSQSIIRQIAESLLTWPRGIFTCIMLTVL